MPGSNAAINPVTNPARQSIASVLVEDAEPSAESASPAPPRPTSLDYYLRLAEKRLGALSPEEVVSSPSERPPSIIERQALRTLTEARDRERPGAALAAFSLDHWRGVLQIWTEEIGHQYPFIDIPRLTLDIEYTARDAAEPPPPPTHTSSPPPSAPSRTASEDMNHRRNVEDMALLVLAVVAIVVDPTLIDAANPLGEEIYRDVLIKTHLADVDRADVSLMAVAVSASLSLSLLLSSFSP